MVTVAQSKHVIYAGFQQAIADQVPKDRVGILVDEEFGSAILRDAVSKGYITVVSVEKSGQEEFEFAYGEDFAQHLEAFHPCTGYLDHPFKNKHVETVKDLHPLLANRGGLVYNQTSFIVSSCSNNAIFT